MRVIVKENNILLTSADVYEDSLIVNLKDRWQYDTSKFSKGRLNITLLNKESVVLAFSGHVRNAVYISQEKDQMIFELTF